MGPCPHLIGISFTEEIASEKLFIDEAALNGIGSSDSGQRACWHPVMLVNRIAIQIIRLLRILLIINVLVVWAVRLSGL